MGEVRECAEELLRVNHMPGPGSRPRPRSLDMGPRECLHVTHGMLVDLERVIHWLLEGIRNCV